MPAKKSTKKTTKKATKKATKKSGTSSVAAPAPAPAPVENPVQAIENKLARIKEIRATLNSMKGLYAEHDALVQDVLPLFITKTTDGFVVRTTVQLGTTTATFSPSFYDEKKACLVAKSWKSTAFSPGCIG